MGMRALVSNVVTEDYVVYAELGGVKRGRILPFYVMRNALMPQVTGLAMSLGAIFNGAIIVEYVFAYPGLGRLLISAVYAGDYGRPRGDGHLDHRRIRGRLPDRHSLSGVRSAGAARLRPAMFKIVRDLFRYNREFAGGAHPHGADPRHGDAVRLLALSAGRHLCGGAGHSALLGPIPSAPVRAVRTCSGSSPSR